MLSNAIKLLIILHDFVQLIPISSLRLIRPSVVFIAFNTKSSEVGQVLQLPVILNPVSEHYFFVLKSASAARDILQGENNVTQAASSLKTNVQKMPTSIAIHSKNVISIGLFVDQYYRNEGFTLAAVI
jgi:hypothetical protein